MTKVVSNGSVGEYELEQALGKLDSAMEIFVGMAFAAGLYARDVAAYLDGDEPNIDYSGIKQLASDIQRMSVRGKVLAEKVESAIESTKKP